MVRKIILLGWILRMELDILKKELRINILEDLLVIFILEIHVINVNLKRYIDKVI